ncbi:MAG TPA: hypothetical protein VN577_22585 [Terriglobales bacterium]|nr:hypothetical protein [Terriglobales bacterium]
MKLLGPWPVIKRSEPGKEQAIIVSMRLSNDAFGNEAEARHLTRLEEQLEEQLKEAGSGEWDGHETGGGYHKIFLYGPCADRLADSVLPILLAYDALPGSYMVKRFGEVGAEEQYIWLGSDQRA